MIGLVATEILHMVSFRRRVHDACEGHTFLQTGTRCVFLLQLWQFCGSEPAGSERSCRIHGVLQAVLGAEPGAQDARVSVEAGVMEEVSRCSGYPGCT